MTESPYSPPERDGVRFEHARATGADTQAGFRSFDEMDRTGTAVTSEAAPNYRVVLLNHNLDHVVTYVRDDDVYAPSSEEAIVAAGYSPDNSRVRVFERAPERWQPR